MRAKFVNEIKRDDNRGALGSVGIGHINSIKGYLELKKLSHIVDLHKIHSMDDVKSTKLPYPDIVIPHVLDTLNCKIDDLIIFTDKDEICTPKIYNYIDDVLFYRWRVDKENYVNMKHFPGTIFNEGEDKEYTARLECFTSKDLNMTQVILFKEFTKTWERTGEKTYIIRYK